MLTKAHVAKGENAAISPADHRLEHVSHCPGTDLSLGGGAPGVRQAPESRGSTPSLPPHLSVPSSQGGQAGTHRTEDTDLHVHAGHTHTDGIQTHSTQGVSLQAHNSHHRRGDHTTPQALTHTQHARLP